MITSIDEIGIRFLIALIAGHMIGWVWWYVLLAGFTDGLGLDLNNGKHRKSRLVIEN
jgi:hypothetical protein